MASPKKAALHQVFVPMVDATDFVSIESGVTASQFNAGTRKFFGINTGGSAAATSGAISKVASLVKSGVFRVTLKGTENNYDQMMIRINGVTGCAEQIIVWSNVDNDDSDIMSALTLIQSMASDAASAAQQANSRVLVAQSFLSDIRSHVSDLQSDFQSRVPKAVATNSQLSDLHSDLRSFLVVMSGIQSDVLSAMILTQSMASDAASAAQQANSRILVNTSLCSDIFSQLSDFRSDLNSFLTTTGVQLNASTLSDIRSAITAGPAGVLTVSDISDIASRVALVLASDLSDILSGVRQTASRALVVQSQASDVYSMLSDLQSDFQSRVPKRVATDSQLSDMTSDLRSLIVAGVGFTVSAISDVASAVRAILVSDLSDILSAAQQANSRVLVVQSMTSDAYSQLSDFRSDLVSLITTTGVQLNASSLSDLRSAITGVTATLSVSDISDIASRVQAVLASDLSDILSAAQQANSRILVTQSMVSDVRSHVSDLQSDFQSRVPKLVATNSQLSDLASDLKSSIGNVSVALTASDISDIASAVAAAVTTVTQSDISNIVSAVRADLSSDLSDIISGVRQTASRVLLVQSAASDTYSLLSDLNSNFNSRVPLEPASRSQLSDLASDVKSAVAGLASMASDAASAAQQANSRVLVVQSQASDIYSLLSDVQSDFQSRVPKRVATDSQLSALASDVISALAAGVPVSASDMSDLRSAIAAGTLTASAISDIASAVAVQLASDLSDTLSGVRQANSRLLVAQSTQSDIYALLSDLHSDVTGLSGVVSDIGSALAAGVDIGPSSLSDLRSMVLSNGVLKPGAEPTAVPGHTATLAEKIDWTHALARNKVKTTSTLMSLRDDADATTIASATVADSGGSFVRGEWSS
jgi:uncharacterized protein YeeX (DUF496 family)